MVKRLGLLGWLLALSWVYAPSALAASESECDIWLCLPAGFATSSCSGARGAFFDRVKSFKPPLPSFSSCSVDDVSGYNMDSKQGVLSVMIDDSIVMDKPCIRTPFFLGSARVCVHPKIHTGV